MSGNTGLDKGLTNTNSQPQLSKSGNARRAVLTTYSTYHPGSCQDIVIWQWESKWFNQQRNLFKSDWKQVKADQKLGQVLHNVAPTDFGKIEHLLICCKGNSKCLMDLNSTTSCKASIKIDRRRVIRN